MKLFRFSLRSLFALVLLAAIVLTVVFAVPAHIRVAILFFSVIGMPGPLAVLLRNGTPGARSFALGGLVAYASWFVLVGVPCGFHAVTHFSQYFGITLASFGPIPVPAGGMGMGGTMGGGFGPVGITPPYLIMAGLYSPWILVPLAGVCSLLAQAAFGAPKSNTVASGDERVSA